METTISLRTAVRGLGVALCVYVIANVLMALLIVRPQLAPAASEAATVAPPTFAATPVSLFTDPANWVNLGGNWSFGDGGLIQAQTDGYDYVFLNGVQYSRQVEITAHFQHVTGVGAGLVFNVPNRDSTVGGHLVRYVDASTLVWGYFDPAQGFVAQGSLGIPNPETNPHTLTVKVGNGVYFVELDGLPVANAVPLLSEGGYLGLTASLAQVIFADFTVRSS